jgi:hypothetical protein
MSVTTSTRGGAVTTPFSPGYVESLGDFDVVSPRTIYGMDPTDVDVQLP